MQSRTETAVKERKRHDVKVNPMKERGRELKGDGISQKCRTGRCQDCTAMKCKHDCGHGQRMPHLNPVADEAAAISGEQFERIVDLAYTQRLRRGTT